jgi:O-succinylbenzoate synthase
MKILAAEIFRYKLPFVRPLMLAGLLQHKREGLVARLVGEDQRIAFAEVAPLPGLHHESLDDAFVALKDAIAVNLATPSPYPSVQMAIDLLRLQLLPSLGLAAQGSVKLRALIDPTSEDALKTATFSVAQGYEALKIKVGRLPLLDEVRLLKNVRDAVGRKVKIDLDANRAWSLEQALEFGHACARLSIECIEEPLNNISDIGEFYDATRIPVALDETLLSPAFALPEALDVFGGAIGALVVKPSLIGGMKRLLALRAHAEERGIALVLSSTGESGVGLTLWSQLAAVGAQSDVAHGFGTYSWLREDLLNPPFRPFRGQVDVASLAKGLAHFSLSESSMCARVWAQTEGAKFGSA